MLLNRRLFLSGLSSSFAVLALPPHSFLSQRGGPLADGACWLTVCIPLVIEDAARNLHTDIIVTSASFEGVEGYKNNSYLTDYEIYLYDFAGSRQPIDGP